MERVRATLYAIGFLAIASTAYGQCQGGYCWDGKSWVPQGGHVQTPGIVTRPVDKPPFDIPQEVRENRDCCRENRNRIVKLEKIVKDLEAAIIKVNRKVEDLPPSDPYNDTDLISIINDVNDRVTDLEGSVGNPSQDTTERLDRLETCGFYYQIRKPNQGNVEGSLLGSIWVQTVPPEEAQFVSDNQSKGILAVPDSVSQIK